MEGQDNNILHAFPHSTIEANENEVTRNDYHGMTLRDYFAAKAMQGLVSSSNTKRVTLWSRILILIGSNKWRCQYDINGSQLARSAYDIADLMLKARNQ